MSAQSPIRSQVLLTVIAVSMCHCAEAEPSVRARTGDAPAPTSTAKPTAPLGNPSSTLLTAPPPSAAGQAAPAPVDSCAPGVYTGTYEVPLLGTGPIMFSLVANQAPAASAIPCQEFCPELVLGSDGGEFLASWLGFEGRATLTGGLDCRTGKLMVEMVDGLFSLGPADDPNAPPLFAGELTGRFTGQFAASATPTIAGQIVCNAGMDVEGTFSVMRAP